MMATTPMFWRIVRRLLTANYGRLFVILLALSAGAAVTAALLNLQIDAKRRLTTEFRALGANVIVAPRDISNSESQCRHAGRSASGAAPRRKRRQTCPRRGVPLRDRRSFQSRDSCITNPRSLRARKARDYGVFGPDGARSFLRLTTIIPGLRGWSQSRRTIWCSRGRYAIASQSG